VLYVPFKPFLGTSLIWIFATAYLMANRKSMLDNTFYFEINKWFSLITIIPFIFYCFYANELLSYKRYIKNQKLKIESTEPVYRVKNSDIYWGIRDLKYNESMYLFRKNKKLESLQVLKTALCDEPFNPKYQNELAKRYFLMNDFDKSKEETRKLLNLNNTILSAHIRMLEIAIAENDPSLYDEYINYPKREVGRLVMLVEKSLNEIKLKNYKKNAAKVFKYKEQLDKLEIQRSKLNM
jgi:hypothetical protein